MDDIPSIQTVKKLSFFPFIFRYGRLVWTGRWFKTIEILETRIVDHIMTQGEGWSQDYYWTSQWKIEKII